MIPVRSVFRNSLTLSLILSASLASGLAADERLEDAIRLYEAGRFSEAKPLLEQVVASGTADGIAHYRLYFCQRNAGEPEHRQTLETARRLLEKEVIDADGFEAAFYLSNTYSNLGLTSEVPRLAADVVGRFEAGEIAPPTEAVEQFRLGKLYADQENDLAAGPWFEKALDGFEASGDAAHGPYLEWGARWLSKRAMDDERYESAAKQLRRLTALENAKLEDFDRLGRASLMIGDYRGAQKAWGRAVVLNPVGGDRYRYGSALAGLCRLTEDIPLSPDEERSWEDLTDEELGQVLKDQAQTVREIKAEAAAVEKMTPAQRIEFDARLLDARPLFVAAGLESVRRGINLREAAFFGGYAPLIFHPREWKLEPPPRAQRKRRNLREYLEELEKKRKDDG